MNEWFTTFFDAVANDVWEAAMPAEATEAEADFLEPESTFEAGAIRMPDRNRYDTRASRLDTTVGSTVSRDMSHWVLTSGELVRLIGGAGFEVDDLAGGTDGPPFALGSPRLLVLARRR